MRRLYRHRQKNAENKGLNWMLTLEEFHKLTSACCFYCGRPPSQKSRSYVYNGIDRQDNLKGYYAWNCVTCCWECNRIKGSLLTVEETRVVSQALVEHRKKKE